ncbi:MAG TPA: MotA/TolQ/ExbB proton channel family protein [Thermoleophilaceae bacterium]
MVIASVEDVIFDVANALRVPVLVLAVVALGLVAAELGGMAVELVKRRRHDARELETAAAAAAAAFGRGDTLGATATLTAVSSSSAMTDAIERIMRHASSPTASTLIAKTLADFDLDSLRRLERTRLLVRAGPALGLMGTLIPLSPALAGLASGDVQELSDNLRVAFSVTVLGLLVGAIAFGISLVRDRLYAKDLSDLEFLAASIEQSRAAEQAVAT